MALRKESFNLATAALTNHRPVAREGAGQLDFACKGSSPASFAQIASAPVVRRQYVTNVNMDRGYTTTDQHIGVTYTAQASEARFDGSPDARFDMRSLAAAMSGAWVLATALTCVPSVAAAEDIDFNGVPFGASEQAFRAKLKGYHCVAVGEKFVELGDRACTAYGLRQARDPAAKVAAVTFAGVPAAIAAFFYGDRLAAVNVTILADHYRHVVGVLQDRHGAPDRTQQLPLRNGSGATVPNTIRWWKRGEVLLVATKFSSDPTRSIINYKTIWGMEVSQKRQQRRQTNRAGDPW